jgi:hypothetical protein
MKSLSRLIALGGVAASLALTTGSLQAQNQNQNQNQNPQQGQGNRQRGGGAPGGGNFDPAQFREQMMQRMRDRFEVKDDEEWKLISERINKVTDAQRGIRTTGGFGGPGGRTGGGGPPGGGGGDNNGGRTRGAGGPPGFTREADPELDALNKAIEAKAPAEEIKVKLARYRDSHKEKEAKLEKAQQDLKEVLSARQEAVAVTMGLLR